MTVKPRNKWVQRLGKSTSRVTKGEVYRLYEDNTVIDDNQKRMSLNLKRSPTSKVYWEIFDSTNKSVEPYSL